jgi:hypothetical protein
MDLFSNPLVNNALKAMSPEQLEHYKKFGESLYGTINFEDSKIMKNLEPPLEESAAYIESGIMSGLLPEDLSEDEVHLLEKAYGEKWYLKYGFTVDEVPESGLSLQMKKEIDEAVVEKFKEEMKKRSEKEEMKKRSEKEK